MDSIINMEVVSASFSINSDNDGLTLMLELVGDGYGTFITLKPIAWRNFRNDLEGSEENAKKIYELFELFKVYDVKDLKGKYVRVEFEKQVAKKLYNIVDMSKSLEL